MKSCGLGLEGARSGSAKKNLRALPLLLQRPPGAPLRLVLTLSLFLSLLLSLFLSSVLLMSFPPSSYSILQTHRSSFSSREEAVEKKRLLLSFQKLLELTLPAISKTLSHASCTRLLANGHVQDVSRKRERVAT